MSVHFYPLQAAREVGILCDKRGHLTPAKFIPHTGEAQELFVPRPRITVVRIQEAVSNHYGLPQEFMVSSVRERRIARPRQIAMYLARELTKNSLPEIGRRFGGRDHTTVMWAVRQVHKRIATNPEIADDVARLRLRIAA